MHFTGIGTFAPEVRIAINGLGSNVATFSAPTTVSTVPEPASALLVGAGLRCCAPDRSQPRRNRSCDFSFRHGPRDGPNGDGMQRTSARRISFSRQPLGVPLPPPGDLTMPVYVYETIPQSDADLPLTFERRQSMSEPCLTMHPDTGAPVRRVLSGGLATFTGTAATTPMRGGGGCGSGCGCAS